MAQHDVHRGDAFEGYLLNCQSDLLDHMKTRFVVPLLPESRVAKFAERLNPVFEIDGRRFIMATQGAATVTARELGPVVASLGNEHERIMGALDMLLTGC
ncbi:plasmid maintenance protein CcdB [Sphingomonas gilva]|uniref:Toxin CcdB n=1 Tax=Sphingomonas gilva TaxID=2305907 RepID=A0A396RMV4_9SPHN|nr:CcdB family protein [Sphingomonas gilva]RHW16482.1 plasmid maintenance protein CcdB [Sphingomonas gilva]